MIGCREGAAGGVFTASDCAAIARFEMPHHTVLALTVALMALVFMLRPSVKSACWIATAFGALVACLVVIVDPRGQSGKGAFVNSDAAQTIYLCVLAAVAAVSSAKVTEQREIRLLADQRQQLKVAAARVMEKAEEAEQQRRRADAEVAATATLAHEVRRRRPHRPRARLCCRSC